MHNIRHLVTMDQEQRHLKVCFANPAEIDGDA